MLTALTAFFFFWPAMSRTAIFAVISAFIFLYGFDRRAIDLIRDNFEFIDCGNWFKYGPFHFVYRKFSGRNNHLTYRIYICYLTLVLSAILWPALEHPFIFSLAFVAIYHEGWDYKIKNFISNIEFVEFDEWLK